MKTFEQYMQENRQRYFGLSRWETEHDRKVYNDALASFDRLNEEVRMRALDGIDNRIGKWLADGRESVGRLELIDELSMIRKFVKELSHRRSAR